MTLIDLIGQIDANTMDEIITNRRFDGVISLYDLIENSSLQIKVQGVELNNKLLSVRVKTPKVDEFVKHINSEYSVSRGIVTLIFKERS